QANGFRVIAARDGEEGLQRFRELGKEINLVITDITMPKMNGDTMIAEIRKLSGSIKIMVVSGFAYGHMAVQLRDHGVTAVIDQPYSPDMLLREVRQALDITSQA